MQRRPRLNSKIGAKSIMKSTIPKILEIKNRYCGLYGSVNECLKLENRVVL